MVDPAIFGHLQTKIDEDTQVREEIKNIVQALERKGTVHIHGEVTLEAF